MHVTPGHASYVIDRLIKERRLTTTQINRYLRDLRDEITTIEERLATLRAASQPNATHSTPHNMAANTASNTTNRTPRKARRHFSPAARAKQQLQGRYLGYMRQLPANARPRFQAIKARDGFTAAITALRQHLGK
jgi:methylmalonyl-CoA mutase N-terminal domain/subunit